MESQCKWSVIPSQTLVHEEVRYNESLSDWNLKWYLPELHRQSADHHSRGI